MDSNSTNMGEEIDQQVLLKALEILRVSLSKQGSLSTRVFKQELIKAGINPVENVINFLKYQRDHHGTNGEKFNWHYHGRSFYSEKDYSEALAREASEADQVVLQNPVNEITEEPVRRPNNSEEKRLGRYVLTALEELYDSPDAPESYAVDVHTERPSGDYRNVDLIAVDWRTKEHFELVTVEVKLDFSNRLIQQAANYRRFSNRVWIAIPVPANTDPQTALIYLRNQDSLLFDHAIDLGLGILACRNAKGRSYEVFPIQWPRLIRPLELERHNFLECYRDFFEEAEVLQSTRRKVRSAV